MTPLPPWPGDDEAMLRWLNEKLDDQQEVEFHARQGKGPSAEEFIRAVNPAAYWRTKLPPDVIIQNRKRGRGKHERRFGDYEQRLRFAVDDVKRIRVLWKEHYGTCHRGKRVTKVWWFAARRWEVEEKRVMDRVEHPSGPKQRAKT